MKLSSEPKPVRIRISLNGIEHTSIDSLKENITPEILEFVDGRLQRWLEKQGCNDLKDEIETIKENGYTEQDRLLKIYNLLLDRDHKNLFEYADEWKKAKDIRLKPILKYCFDKMPCGEDTLNNYIGCLTLDEWDEIISGKKDSKMDFLLLKKYLEEKNVEKAKTLFERIEERNDCPEAIDFYYKNLRKRPFAKNSEEELRDIIKDFSKYNKLKATTPEESEIYLFIWSCSSIFAEQRNKIKYTAKKELTIKESDILKDEKHAVRAMICCYSDYHYAENKTTEYKSEFDKISKDYKFRNRIKPSGSLEEIREVVKNIVEDLLFEKK